MMYDLKKIVRSCFAFLIMTAIALPAYALDLQTARVKGMVAEKLTGYVEAIDKSSETQALVSNVNARRQAEYQRISKANGQPVEIVAKLASEQIIGKLPSGSLYEGAGGWLKR